MARKGGPTAIDLSGHERRYRCVNAILTDPLTPHVANGSSARVRRAGLLVGLAYWTVLLMVLTGLAVLDGWETWGTFAARCINTVIAVAMSLLIAHTVTRFGGGSFTLKAWLVLILTLVVSSVYFFITVWVYTLFGAYESGLMFSEALRMILYFFAQFLGWSALLLAMIYQAQVKEGERLLSEMREQAYGAQMRALRYQINPHFLFNTLNALATMIEERELPNAERMVLSLSAFLRSTLALDPLQDITLAAELDIQSRYLEIERERFSDRLTVSVDVPETLRQALVPSLILQPLVENAIKHGVGAIERSVRIRIGAAAEGDQLDIFVENDARDAAPVTSGTGVGLENVAQRLAARFGETGRLTNGWMTEGVFRSTVSLPLRFGPP